MVTKQKTYTLRCKHDMSKYFMETDQPVSQGPAAPLTSLESFLAALYIYNTEHPEPATAEELATWLGDNQYTLDDVFKLMAHAEALGLLRRSLVDGMKMRYDFAEEKPGEVRFLLAANHLGNPYIPQPRSDMIEARFDGVEEKPYPPGSYHTESIGGNYHLRIMPYVVEETVYLSSRSRTEETLSVKRDADGHIVWEDEKSSAPVLIKSEKLRFEEPEEQREYHAWFEEGFGHLQNETTIGSLRTVTLVRYRFARGYFITVDSLEAFMHLSDKALIYGNGFTELDARWQLGVAAPLWHNRLDFTRANGLVPEGIRFVVLW